MKRPTTSRTAPRARRERSPTGVRSARLAPLVSIAVLPLACAWLGIAPGPRPPTPASGVVPAAPAAAALASSQRVVVGRVFEDLDRDRRRDPGEPGLPGVRVSNGVDVVTTAADGVYRLPVADDTIVFVIKPRDWMTPVAANGLPRFHYIHKPDGSPDAGFRHRGVPPTGPLPESVDFPLYRRPESERFRIAVVSDPQPYDLVELSYYARGTIAELIGSDVVLGISLGDLVGDDLDLFEPLNEVQGLVGVPWYNVIGNHDLNFLSEDDAQSDETYERVYGPATYAFQVGRVHFALLDDVVWDGYAGRKVSGRPFHDQYTGGLRADQLRFLENWLAGVPEEDLVVLAMHIPMARRLGARGLPPQRLLEVLSRHPRSLSLSGHSHTQGHVFYGSSDGYAPASGGEHHHVNVGAASGSWYRGPPDEAGLPTAIMRDGVPPGYALLRFDGVGYEIRYRASRRPDSHQMQIDAPDRVDRDALRDARVVVNVWNGSEKTRVSMRVRPGVPGEPGASGGPASGAQRGGPMTVDGPEDASGPRLREPDPLAWRRLRRRPGIAPFFLEDGQRRPSLRSGWKPLPEPRRTEHLWVGELPAGLVPGIHLIEVRVRDPFGNSDRALRPLLVE